MFVHRIAASAVSVLVLTAGALTGTTAGAAGAAARETAAGTVSVSITAAHNVVMATTIQPGVSQFRADEAGGYGVAAALRLVALHQFPPGPHYDEAVNLLVRYLFETKRVNRVRLVIHPENIASRRLAEKCGFRHEGTARGAWYNQGRHQDVEIYAILHEDVIAP